MIERARTPQDVVGAVVEWGATVVGQSDAFAGWAYETGLHAAMAGQLMVRAVELEEEADDGEEGTVDLARVFGRNTDESFFGIPFEAAVEFFRGKRIISIAEFDALRDRYRAAGFASRTIAQRGMTARAHSLIERFLSEGLTLREVANALRTDEEIQLGITPANRAALNMVTRTNVASAYGHGRWEAMNDPAVAALRPYMMVVTAGDVRVRPNHAVLHQRVFRIGTPLCARHATPLGFRCRCSSNTLSQRGLERRKLEVTETEVAGGGPDPGWEGAPAPLVA
jgi:SPP1 gp7 family putative phage head morphogenesis protein